MGKTLYGGGVDRIGHAPGRLPGHFVSAAEAERVGAARNRVLEIEEATTRGYETGEKNGSKAAEKTAHKDQFEQRRIVLDRIGFVLDRSTTDPEGALEVLRLYHADLQAMHEADSVIQERLDNGEEIPDYELRRFVGDRANSTMVEKTDPSETGYVSDPHIAGITLS